VYVFLLLCNRIFTSNVNDLGSWFASTSESPSKDASQINGIGSGGEMDLDTFWQSQGQSLPHFIDIDFERSIDLESVMIFFDPYVDMDYTPNHIQIEAGTSNLDLRIVGEQEMVEYPDNWIELNFEYIHDYITYCF
jgi:hypothetical protein